MLKDRESLGYHMYRVASSLVFFLSPSLPLVWTFDMDPNGSLDFSENKKMSQFSESLFISLFVRELHVCNLPTKQSKKIFITLKMIIFVSIREP